MDKLYTCTMNPAIDLFIETDALLPNTVNRTVDDDIQANGKGVNVSLVLKMLGAKSTATGFSGGFTGRYIEAFLNEKGVETAFVQIEGMTRINVFTQVNHDQNEYKLVNKGPQISPEKVEELLAFMKKIEKGDFLFVSGSLPRGVNANILPRIGKIAKENDFHLILDTSDPEVLDCLVHEPYLLKPNEEELAAWFSTAALDQKASVQYAERLLKAGAQRVLLSLGENGAVYLDGEKRLYGNAPSGKVVNTACAGDTLLATFVATILAGEGEEVALKKAIAAGSSTAFRKGITDFSDVEVLMKETHIKNIERGEA